MAGQVKKTEKNSAAWVGRFGAWLVDTNQLTDDKAKLQLLMEQYMIEIETIPEKYRERVIETLRR
jgi:uncharacterized protein YsxB (DUF464 family)